MWDSQISDKFTNSFTEISLDLRDNDKVRSYLMDINKERIDLRFKETETHKAIHISIENREGAITILKKDDFTEKLLTQTKK
ncbi:MAG: hypothetical protein ACR2M6_02435 [Vampirovibrionia bacterium]